MSATDELRRLLDERGVEWESGLPTETIVRVPIDTLYVERQDGRMHVYFRSYLTPAQAIDATLGRGTCHRVMYKPTNTLVCSECGAGMPKQLDRYCYLHYCPNCGRKVVE